MKLEKNLMKKNFTLMLALAFAILSFVLLHQYVKSIIKPEKVVIAARDIKTGETFKKEDLKVVEIPGKGVIPEIIREPSELLGQQAAYPLKAGQQICSTALRTANDKLALRPDQRAVAIKATLTNALGGRLDKGARVDVFVRWQDKSSGLVYSQPLLTDITVLGVLDEQGRDFESRQKDGLDKGGRLMPGAVLLAIEQKRVAELLRYETLGELVLAGSARPE